MAPIQAAAPPNAMDAEAAVLSAVLLDTHALDRLQGVLALEHFYADANRRIFEAALEIRAAGSAVDVVSVAAWLRDRDRLAQVGGSPYLAQLADATPAVAHVADHAQIIVRAWCQREFSGQLAALASEARSGAELAEVTARAQEVLDRFGSRAPVGAVGLADVLDGWRVEGSLVHEPTGIAGLDELTGGGPVYGTRWYLAGAPDAGKTALLVQLADVWALRGVHVGILAVDEEPSDIATRLVQRLGYARHDCEIRDHASLDRIGSELAALPIRLYDDAWTIEGAAADLSATGSRAALLIDSIQTVRCDAELAAERELSEVAAVTARVRALRAVASRHRLIAVSTSEMGRSAYRSGDPEQQTNTLASSKWSGAIEYSARVLIGLRSVPGETDLLDLEVAKNKHGPRDRHVYLRIDRRSQTLAATNYAAPPVVDEPSGARAGRAREQARTDASGLAAVLAEFPGLGSRELRAAARARLGVGSDRVDAALAALGQSVVRLRDGTTSPARHYLAGALLPADLLALCDGHSAERIRSARPPAREARG